MRRTVATPFGFRHLPLPYCLRSRPRSRTPRPPAIVSTPVTSRTISKSIRTSAQAERSTAAALAGGLAGDAEVQAVLVGEVLHGAEEVLAVARRHHGRLVGGLDGVGVAVADDALGAHGVQNFFEQAGLVDPHGYVEARGVALDGRLHIEEADDRLSVIVEVAIGMIIALGMPEG